MSLEEFPFVEFFNTALKKAAHVLEPNKKGVKLQTLSTKPRKFAFHVIVATFVPPWRDLWTTGGVPGAFGISGASAWSRSSHFLFPSP
jgi:hypothetical protein